MTDNNTNTRDNFTRIRFWLGWTIVLVLYIVIRINVVEIPLDRDEGIFGYSGQVILDGGLPYKDVFEHKPPMVFYLNALALLFFPPTAFGIHCFLHIYNFLTLIALYLCAAVYTKSRMTGFWVAVVYAVFSSTPSIQGFTASTEMFLLLPIALSLLFALLANEYKKSYYLVLSGACSALAFFTKQTSAPMIFFIFMFLAFVRINLLRNTPTTGKEVTLDLIKWSAGFIAITLGIAAYFYYHKIFGEFFYWSWTHGFLYSKNYSMFSNFPKIYHAIIEIVKTNLPLILILLAGNLMALCKNNYNGHFALIFLIFAMLSTIPGAGYPHYFAQVAPAVAIAGGFGISYLTKLIKKKELRAAASVFFALAVIGTPIAVSPGYYITKSPDQISRDFFGYNPFPESIELAEFLVQRTTKAETVFIFGSEAQIFVLSQRTSATSFALIYPLMSSYPRYMEFQNRAWQEVMANKPKYIITIPLHTSLLYDGKADLWIMRQTRQLLKADYYLEAAVTPANPKGWLIFFNETDKMPMDKQNFLAHIYKRKPVSTPN